MINSRKLEIRRKRRFFLTVGGAYFRGTQTARSFSSWQQQHQHQQQQSLTGAVDGYATLRVGSGASRTQFDAPEPIPAPRAARAAPGTHILRFVHVTALRQHSEAWWTPGQVLPGRRKRKQASQGEGSSNNLDMSWMCRISKYLTHESC